MHTQDYQNFKGAGFKAQLKAISDLFGERGLQKVLIASSVELRALAKKKLLDNEWVPDRLSGELLAKADQVLGKGDLSLIRKIGYMLAKDNLSGIYKAFIKLSSIEAILKRANLVWKKYYSHGYIDVIDKTPGHYIFEVANYQPYTSTCIGLLGWLDMFLEVYKLKGKATHTECKLRGGTRCIFELIWEVK